MEKFTRFLLIWGGIAAFLALFLLLFSVSSRKIEISQVSRQIINRLPGKTAHFLTVGQPEDNAVVQNPRLEVSGRTTAGSTVVMIAGEDTQSADVDQSGEFFFNITLSEGPASIEVTSFGQNGEEATVTREVFYSINVP